MAKKHVKMNTFYKTDGQKMHTSTSCSPGAPEQVKMHTSCSPCVQKHVKTYAKGTHATVIRLTSAAKSHFFTFWSQMHDKYHSLGATQKHEKNMLHLLLQLLRTVFRFGNVKIPLQQRTFGKFRHQFYSSLM